MAAVRRRQELRRFEADAADRYTHSSLPDLVGVRVLVFPRRVLNRVHALLQTRLIDWRADPVVDSARRIVAFKYHGRWSPQDEVDAEIQVVSMLVGLFWDVEHSAIYKTTPQIQAIAGSAAMRDAYEEVLRALSRFETEFDRRIEADQ